MAGRSSKHVKLCQKNKHETTRSQDHKINWRMTIENRIYWTSFVWDLHVSSISLESGQVRHPSARWHWRRNHVVIIPLLTTLWTAHFGETSEKELHTKILQNCGHLARCDTMTSRGGEKVLSLRFNQDHSKFSLILLLIERFSLKTLTLLSRLLHVLYGCGDSNPSRRTINRKSALWYYKFFLTNKKTKILTNMWIMS